MADAPSPQIEYTIYTFDMPVPKQKSQTTWKKHSTIDDMGRAMKSAEELLSSSKYQKVEVKKKFFDQKKNRVVDMTLKTFELAPKKDRSVILAILFALICGGGAFALSYFLSQS